jgi:hypothetical protein
MINKENPIANPFLIFAIVMVFMYIVYYIITSDNFIKW